MRVFFPKSAACAALLLLAACHFDASVFGADPETVAYLNGPVRHIFVTWRVSDLQRQATTDFFKATPVSEVKKLFRACARKLGPLRSWSIEEAGREARVGVGAYDLTKFSVKARFAKAPADLYIELFRQSGSWKLGTFRINSDALYE